MAEMEIARATTQDLETVVSILEDAAWWVQGKGIRQWWPGLFSDERRDDAERAIAHGETYLAMQGNLAMATVSLEWSDALFWPNAADDSIYLHRLAVRRAHAGQEVGKRLLYWAGPQTAAAGRKYLRLDCMAENPALCHYYLMCGFYFWGEVSVRSFKSALWEKEIR